MVAWYWNNSIFSYFEILFREYRLPVLESRSFFEFMVYANIGLQANIRYISNQISHVSVHFYLNILIIKFTYILNSYYSYFLFD